VTATIGVRKSGQERTYGQWWDWHGEYKRVSIAELTAFGRAAYQAVGATPENAAFIFEGSLDKTIQGDHARGVVYFPSTIRQARAGLLDVDPKIEIVREKGATAVVDGGEKAVNSLVCRDAMTLAIEKARTYGVGVVGACAAAGLLTTFALMATDAGMVGIVLTQTGPGVAPLGGYVPMLGNGPMAIAVPARDHDPVVLDMAFTQTSASGVLLAAQQGQTSIPDGLLLDRQGNPTSDPRDFFSGGLTKRTGTVTVEGTLTPLGNSHKGYAMIFMIGLLASVLSDTSPPWDLAANLPKRGKHGSVMIAIDLAALNPDDAVGKVDAFIEKIASSPTREPDGEILYPGQRSQELRRKRRAEGWVDVPVPQLQEIRLLAEELGLELPKTLQI
jgi:LDH2 family malate/lactate/ureidoglycolate dehydrogenase